MVDERLKQMNAAGRARHEGKPQAAFDAGWDESKHERASNGEFGSTAIADAHREKANYHTEKAWDHTSHPDVKHAHWKAAEAHNLAAGVHPSGNEHSRKDRKKWDAWADHYNKEGYAKKAEAASAAAEATKGRPFPPVSDKK